MGGKLDDYQNFAKAYRAEGWEDLMADRTPNRARVKSATEFREPSSKATPCSGTYADPLRSDGPHSGRRGGNRRRNMGAQAQHGLRDHFGDADWLRARDNVRMLATWLGRTWERRNPREGSAARVFSIAHRFREAVRSAMGVTRSAGIIASRPDSFLLDDPLMWAMLYMWSASAPHSARRASLNAALSSDMPDRVPLLQAARARQPNGHRTCSGHWSTPFLIPSR